MAVTQPCPVTPAYGSFCQPCPVTPAYGSLPSRMDTARVLVLLLQMMSGVAAVSRAEGGIKRSPVDAVEARSYPEAG